MIDCNGDGAVASSSAAGSCNTSKFNMSSPGFCTKAAFSCSSNMKKCTEKAQKFVTDIKADRTKRRENYNQNVESTGKQMLGMFDTGMAKYMKEAEILRGMFSKGFTNPQPDRDLSGPEQYMSKAPYSPGDAGDKIDLKDPVAYLKMVKGNLAKLQEEVTKQQEAIMGEGGPLQKHIADTTLNYQNAEKKSKDLASDCLAAYDSYKTLLENQQKMATDKANADQKLQGELGESNGALCSAHTRIMSNNPNGACEIYENLGKDALKNASKSGGNTGDINSMIMEMEETCAGVSTDGAKALDICAASGDLPKDFTDFFNKQYSSNFEKPIDKYDYFTKVCAVNNTGKGDKENVCNLESQERIPKELKPVNGQLTAKAAALEELSKQIDPKNCDPVTTAAFDKTNDQWSGSTVCLSPAKYDCSKLSGLIETIYKQGYKKGLVSSSKTQSNSPHPTCSGNNNSGPYNTKDSMNPGSNPNNPTETSRTATH